MAGYRIHRLTPEWAVAVAVADEADRQEAEAIHAMQRLNIHNDNRAAATRHRMGQVIREREVRGAAAPAHRQREGAAGGQWIWVDDRVDEEQRRLAHLWEQQERRRRGEARAAAERQEELQALRAAQYQAHQVAEHERLRAERDRAHARQLAEQEAFARGLQAGYDREYQREQAAASDQRARDWILQQTADPEGVEARDPTNVGFYPDPTPAVSPVRTPAPAPGRLHHPYDGFPWPASPSGGHWDPSGTAYWRPGVAYEDGPTRLFWGD